MLSNDLLITFTTRLFAASNVMSSLHTQSSSENRVSQVCALLRWQAASRQAGISTQQGSRSYSRIVRLEDRLRSAIVVADGHRLPAPVIPARVALVQLETKVLIPTCEQEAYAERPLSCEGHGW